MPRMTDDEYADWKDEQRAEKDADEAERWGDIWAARDAEDDRRHDDDRRRERERDRDRDNLQDDTGWSGSRSGNSASEDVPYWLGLLICCGIVSLFFTGTAAVGRGAAILGEDHLGMFVVATIGLWITGLVIGTTGKPGRSIVGLALTVLFVGTAAYCTRQQAEIRDRTAQQEAAFDRGLSRSGPIVVIGTSQPTTSSFTVRVVASALNIRRTPATNGPIAGSLTEGTTVAIICRLDGSAVNGTTSWARLLDGTYISMAFVVVVGAPAPSCAAP